jgi:rSAM/selenodomain-associated transferase 2
LRALLRARGRQLLRLSLVIPALNAEPDLRALLPTLDGVAEIIVADGGSADGSAEVARAAGARVLLAPRGRGIQLAAGAEAATSDWLLFLHADTHLGPGWSEAVARHVAEQPDTAACFRFRLDDPAWQARLIERGVAARVRGLGLPYGDQGLLISRAFYDEVGGYAPLPLMEDVDFVRRIGRRRLRMLPVDAVTSAKRWRRDGWFRRTGRNALCLGLYLAGVRPEKIARLYR